MPYYKALTHDFRPPIQGGEPVFDGTLPYKLPRVSLSTGTKECAEGWNFTDNLAAVLRIAGLWPDGRPSTVFEIEPSPDAIQRGDKWRTSELTLLRQLTETEVRDGVLALSAPFGQYAVRMTDEQMAWREALARPRHDATAVAAGLLEALAARHLPWTLRRFDTARTAWVTWDTWDAWAAGNARAAWDAWDARAVWDAGNARDTRAVWDAWAAGAAWDAWAARDAMVVTYSGLMGWISATPEILTTGLRDAYRSGLAIAVPTEPNELGWAMEPDPTGTVNQPPKG